jgi:formamidopyrimidine-DNA glycosylase
VLELPEVEVLRKDLEKEVVGKRVKDVIVETAPSIVRPFHRTRPEFVKALEGRKIEGSAVVDRTIFLDLDEDQTWICRRGGPRRCTARRPTSRPGPDTHLVVTFTIGGAIHLSDTDAEPDASTGVVPPRRRSRPPGSTRTPSTRSRTTSPGWSSGRLREAPSR